MAKLSCKWWLRACKRESNLNGLAIGRKFPPSIKSNPFHKVLAHEEEQSMKTENLRINQLSPAAYEWYLKYLEKLDTLDIEAYSGIHNYEVW